MLLKAERYLLEVRGTLRVNGMAHCFERETVWCFLKCMVDVSMWWLGYVV